jgi:hypothetical protein
VSQLDLQSTREATIIIAPNLLRLPDLLPMEAADGEVEMGASIQGDGGAERHFTGPDRVSGNPDTCRIGTCRWRPTSRGLREGAGEGVSRLEAGPEGKPAVDRVLTIVGDDAACRRLWWESVAAQEAAGRKGGRSGA